MHTGYELVDPRDCLPFYVGITDDIYRRFRQHMRCNGQNPAKDARVKELQKEQQMMIMNVLFRAKSDSEALILETEWINKYLSQGIKLLNIVGVENPVIVPKDPSLRKLKPYEMGVHVPIGKMDQFWYRTEDGRVVNLEHSKAVDFDAFISRYIKIKDVNRLNWSLYDRSRVVDFAEKKGVVLDFCEPVLAR